MCYNRLKLFEKEIGIMPSKVYFTRTLTSEKVVELYKALGISLPGKVAVKLATRISWGRTSGNP